MWLGGGRGGEGEGISHFDSCEADMMSLIEINEMTKELGCTGIMNYHCHIPKVGWKLLETDVDAVNLEKICNQK